MIKKIRIIKFLFIVTLVTFGTGIFSACGGEQQDSEKDNSQSQTLLQLETPSNLHVEDDALVWNEVAQATYYVISVNGEEEEIAGNAYYLPTFTQTTTLEIEVKASGDGVKYTDSDWAPYTYLYEQPTEALSYTLLEDGSGYEVSRKYSSSTKGLEGRVVIPDYYNGLPVKSIAEQAFSIITLITSSQMSVPGNKVTTSFRLPAYLENIGNLAFAYCYQIESLELPESVTSIGIAAFRDCTKLSTINLPTSFTQIPQMVFAGTNISEFTISENVTSVGRNAFSRCANLKKVVIPDSVTEIEYEAFQNCSSLTQIVIPDSVTTIGDEAFLNCSNLAQITFPNNLQNVGYDILDGTKWYENQPIGFVILSGNVLYGYKGETENLVIDLENIKCVASRAFSKRTDLKIVTFSTKAELFGKEIFYGCNSLVEVTVSGTTEIPKSMFYACKNLQRVIISSDVITIGEKAFDRCSSLETISFAEGLKTIGEYAFEFCTSLTEIILPSTVETIGKCAFSYCSALTSITIPDSVTSIDSGAFYDCGSLTSVYYKGTAEDWDKISFDSGNYLTSVTKYYYSETEPTESGNYWHYDTDGVTPVIWKKES
jgi:hypothetical protein